MQEDEPDFLLGVWAGDGVALFDLFLEGGLPRFVDLEEEFDAITTEPVPDQFHVLLADHQHVWVPLLNCLSHIINSTF